MKMMKVIAIGEEKQDKNGRTFKNVTVSNPTKIQVTDPFTNETTVAKVPALTNKVPTYKENYLDNAPDFLWDAEVGDLVLGEVVTRKVEEYDITNIETGEVRTVDTYTTAVFGDNSDIDSWEVAILRAFRSSGHPIEGEAELLNQTSVSLTIDEEQEEKEEKAETKTNAGIKPDIEF